MSRKNTGKMTLAFVLALVVLGAPCAWAQYDLLLDMTITYGAFGIPAENIETTDENGPLHLQDPNGMIDATEIALLEIILEDPSIDLSGTGGLTHGIVMNAWITNLNGMTLYINTLNMLMPGSIPPPLDVIVARFGASYITLGTDSRAYIDLLLVGMLGAPPTGSFGDMYDTVTGDTFLAPAADADGDGDLNQAEYDMIIAYNPELDPDAPGEPQMGDAALRALVYAGATLEPLVKDYDFIADLAVVLGALGLPPGAEEMWDFDGNGILDGASLVLLEYLIEDPGLGLMKAVTHADGLASWTINIAGATLYGDTLFTLDPNPLWASSQFKNVVATYCMLGTITQMILDMTLQGEGAPPLGAFGDTYDVTLGDAQLLATSDPDDDGATLLQEWGLVTGVNIYEKGASFAQHALDGTTDITPPSVTSIVLETGSPTTGGTVQFTVTFDEEVVNFASEDDVVVTKDASVTLDAAIAISSAKAPDAYLVTLTNVAGDGDLSIAVAVGLPADVEDLGGNAFAGDGNNSSPTVIVNTTPLAAAAVGDTVIEKIVDESVTMEVSVSGENGPVTYQWYKKDAAKADLPVGTDSPSLTLEDLLVADSGEYFCEVTDGVEIVSSPIFTLTVGLGLPVAQLVGLIGMSVLLAAGGASVLRKRSGR